VEGRHIHRRVNKPANCPRWEKRRKISLLFPGGIYLRDEINFFRKSEPPPRPLAVAQSTALPLYVQTHHAKISKSGERLDIYVGDTKT